MRFRNRGFIINPFDLSEKLIHRLASSGINELGIHSGGGRRASELIANTLNWHKLSETQRLYALAQNNGISVEYDEHALRTLVPASLFETKPDWFRMDKNGNRVADFNICASNDEALEYLSASTEKLAMTLKTPSHRYAYWVDDVTDSICHCERCAKLNAADQALILTNAMLRGIKRVDSQAKIGFLAYNDAMDVPNHTLPDEGVYLEFAPINRDSDVPIGDASCLKNKNETAKLKDMFELFGAENSRALEYWMDNSRFSSWTRPPKRFTLNSYVLKKDLEYYALMGFQDITTFGCYLGSDYEELYGEADIEEYGRILSEEF